MANYVVKRMDHLETKGDIISGGALVVEKRLYIGDMILERSGVGIQCFVLKKKVPNAMVGVLDTVEKSCEQYYKIAQSKGFARTIHDVFPKSNLHLDFDEVEIDAHSFQPKLDVITERLDQLDLVNALDAELVAEFVTQLSAGGDAFQLIDAKVLVEEQRALIQEQGVRNEFAAADSSIKGSVSSSYDSLKKIEDIIVNESLSVDNDFSADRVRLDALELTYSDTVVDQKIDADVLVESQRAQAEEVSIRNDFGVADSAIKGSVSSSYDSLKKIEDIVSAEIVQTDADFVLDRDRLVLLEATYSNTQVDSEIDSHIAALVDSSPAALSTLNSLAAALNDDVAFSATVSAEIGTKVAQSVYDPKQAAVDALVLDNTAKRSYSTAEEAKVALNVLKITYDAASAVSLNTAKVTFDKATEVNDNTAKRSYPQSEEDKVAANVLKRSYPTTEEDKVTANSLKNDYPQTESDKVAANVLKVTFDKASEVAANSLKNDYPQTERDKVTVNSAKITYDDASAVSLNTAKLTFDKATEVNDNTAKRSYPTTEEDKVTLNSAKISYDAASAVALNTLKNDYPQTERDKVTLNAVKISYDAASAVALNTAKLTFPASSNTLLHTTHAALHTSHAADLLTKQSLLNGNHLHLDSGGSRIGIGTDAPSYHLHIKDSGDPTVKIERASNNYLIINETHFMIVKPAGTQFDFNSQGNTQDMVFKTNNLERIRIAASSGDVTAAQNLNVSESLFVSGTAPASESEAAVVGEIRFDASYIYIFTGTVWKRAAFSAW